MKKASEQETESADTLLMALHTPGWIGSDSKAQSGPLAICPALEISK